MNCFDLFVAALAVSIGFRMGRDFWQCWVEAPIRCPEGKNRVGHIVGWVALCVFVVYVAYMFDKTVLW